MPELINLQIIFVRFSITLALSTMYMWYTRVPDFPWGIKEIRLLLVLRGLAGFVGVFGFYYSVKYLPLAEAVVISYLTPLLTAWSCSLVLHTNFTRRQLLGGLVSLLGVILIARPASLFTLAASAPEDDVPVDPNAPEKTTTKQRLSSIGLGLIANVAAASVYTLIRVIGDRAHPLISVSYYGILATLLSFFAILVIPGLSFQIPRDFREWLLLLSLGILGFLLQFSMTKGLQLDRTNKATNMMYTQIVFALLLDWGIWNILPGIWSIVGGLIVLASTLWVAVQKVEEQTATTKTKDGDVEYGLVVGEDVTEMMSIRSDSSEASEDAISERHSVGENRETRDSEMLQTTEARMGGSKNGTLRLRSPLRE